MSKFCSQSDFFQQTSCGYKLRAHVSFVVCKMAIIRYGIKMEYEINRKEIKTFFVQFQCKREIPILREPNWENYIFIFRYIYAMHADAWFSVNGTKKRILYKAYSRSSSCFEYGNK